MNPNLYLSIYLNMFQNLYKLLNNDEEFKKWVVAKWSIAPERKMKKYGHPAMFPEELVRRGLKLFGSKALSNSLELYNGNVDKLVIEDIFFFSALNTSTLFLNISFMSFNKIRLVSISFLNSRP